MVNGSGSIPTEVTLYLEENANGVAKYRSIRHYAREYFGPGVKSGILNINAYYASVGNYSCCVYTNKFKLQEINFRGNLPIRHSGDQIPHVCYPFGATLQMGTIINNNDFGQYWPLECQFLMAKIHGHQYSGDDNFFLSEGLIEPREFDTGIVLANYHIGNYFRQDTVNITWKESIEEGPERDMEVPSYIDRVHVYHGFRALPPFSWGIDVIDLNQHLNIAAVPEPELLQHSQIYYTWFIHPQDGHGHLSNLQSTDLGNTFWADYPGDYQISYDIDYDPGEGAPTSAQSEPTTIHVRPALTINAPPDPVDGFNYCYNYDFGHSIYVLNIECAASAMPPSVNDEIAWSIDLIPTSYLQNEPDELIGQTITINFNELPVENSSYGPKTVTARLDQWDIEESREVNIFFPMNGHHNPGDADPDHPTPNWFFLWRDGEVAHPRMWDFYYDKLVRYVAGGYYNPEFDTLWLTEWSNDESNPDHAYGGINIPYKCGVDRTAHCIEHELHHKEIYDKWKPGGDWYILYGPHPRQEYDVPNLNDPDNDWLPSDFENQLSEELNLEPPMNPNFCDTYDYDSTTGDFEVYCEIMARDFYGHAERDWSHGQFSKQWPGSAR